MVAHEIGHAVHWDMFLMTVAGVQQAASETGSAANQTLQSAAELAKQAESLRTMVDGFLADVKAA